MDWSAQVDTAELRHHVVRLDAVDGKILGTGVSVAPGLVLTCAHVVKDGRTEVLVRPRTGDPRVGTVQARSADPPPGWREPVWPFPDLAIITHQGEPLGRYALLSSQGSPGQQADCVTWGYPERRDGVEPAGDPAAFRYTGVTGEDYLVLKGDVARPGLSGAPLVCPEKRAVVGLVAATRGAQSAVGGWASPIRGLIHPDSPECLRLAGAELLATNRTAVLANRASWEAVVPIQQFQPGPAPFLSELTASRKQQQTGLGNITSLAYSSLDHARLEIFAVSSGRLWHHWRWQAANWSPWRQFDPLPGNVPVASVTAGQHAPDYQDLFAIAADGQLFHTWYGPASAWAPWEQMGGLRNVNSLAYSSLDPAHLEIFAVSSGKLWHRWRWLPGRLSTWTQFNPLPGNVPVASVTAGHHAPDYQDLFAIAADGDLLHTWHDGPTNTWAPWEKHPPINQH